MTHRQQSLTDDDKDRLFHLISHRYIKFQVGMNLILRQQPTAIGVFKCVERSNSDTQVPVDYLNSLNHIDSLDFIPDFAHEPTANMALAQAFPNAVFKYSEPQSTSGSGDLGGWYIQSPSSVITDRYPNRASALIWALIMMPPF